jgi:hypothetical protein
MTRLSTAIGASPLLNPVIRGSGEPVTTEAGIRAALRAGAAGVIAKSVNEQSAAGRQLDRAGYVRLDPSGAPTTGRGVPLFNRSGLTQRDTAEWFAAIAGIGRDARADGRFVAAPESAPAADAGADCACHPVLRRADSKEPIGFLGLPGTHHRPPARCHRRSWEPLRYPSPSVARHFVMHLSDTEIGGISDFQGGRQHE